MGIGDWRLGIGDWGLETVDWGLGIGVGKPSYCYSPRPPLHKGWVASVYILSCTPPLAERERATKWRGGICQRHAAFGSYERGAPYFQRTPSSFTIYHSPFFSGPLPPLSWSPSPVKQGEARF